MWNNYWAGSPGMLFAAPFAGFLAAFLVPLMVWSLFWKGWALWRAAKNDAKAWFIVLLILNTAGILEILYIFVFGKAKRSSRKS